jgi:uncharacterized protein GlcG (DUF336 family)
MKKISALLLAALAAFPAAAEERPVLTQKMAMDGLAACAGMQAANGDWAPMGVVVVDRHMNIVGAMRHADASPFTMTAAERKARAAVVFGIPSEKMGEGMDGKTLFAMGFAGEILPVPGGLPIKSGGYTIGAVGAMGSAFEHDSACAKAAADAAGK